MAAGFRQSVVLLLKIPGFKYRHPTLRHFLTRFAPAKSAPTRAESRKPLFFTYCGQSPSPNCLKLLLRTKMLCDKGGCRGLLLAGPGAKESAETPLCHLNTLTSGHFSLDSWQKGNLASGRSFLFFSFLFSFFFFRTRGAANE